MQRFIGVDPLADQFPGWSPYNYTMNNPINMIDPTGMAPEWIEDGNGNLIGEAGDDAVSLADHLGVSQDEANEIFNNLDNWNGGNNTTGISDVEGHTLSLGMTGPIADGDIVHDASNVATALTGIGLNLKQINRYGNTGNRFRADIFDQKYIRFSGKTGEKLVTGLKYGAPALSAGSALLTLNSDQSTGWKAADLTSTGVGVFGGPYGAAASVLYGVGIKPLVRPVISPTPAESRSLHEFQNRNSNSSYCRRLRCR